MNGILFADEEFLTSEKEFLQKLKEKTTYFKKSNKNISELKTEKEYIDYIDNFKKRTYWAEGNYKAEFTITLSNKKVFKKSLSFDITERDIELLKVNSDIYSKRTEEIWINGNIDELKNLPYNWIYPMTKDIS